MAVTDMTWTISLRDVIEAAGFIFVLFRSVIVQDRINQRLLNILGDESRPLSVLGQLHRMHNRVNVLDGWKQRQEGRAEAEASHDSAPLART